MRRNVVSRIIRTLGPNTMREKHCTPGGYGQNEVLVLQVGSRPGFEALACGAALATGDTKGSRYCISLSIR